MTDRPKKPPYFDKEEKELIEAVERGEFQPSEDAAERIAMLKQAAIDSVREREVKPPTDPLPSSEPNGAAIARIMEKVAARGIFSEIEDPSEWQRQTRKDRPLPFRDED